MELDQDDVGGVGAPVDLGGEVAGVDGAVERDQHGAIDGRRAQPARAGEHGEVVGACGVGRPQHQPVGAGERVRRSEVHQAAAIDHDEPVADLLELAQQV